MLKNMMIESYNNNPKGFVDSSNKLQNFLDDQCNEIYIILITSLLAFIGRAFTNIL